MWLRGRLPAWAFAAATGIPSVGSAIITVHFVTALNRNRKRAMELEGRMCWHCGHALSGLADAATCPECARAYEVPELRRLWSAHSGTG